MTVEQRITRVPWTRDEIILACELVVENGWRELRPSRPEVKELSELLNRSPLHPVELRHPEFRNANGVARKTTNIATRHPDYQGLPTRGNKLDQEVLHEFIADPNLMRGLAAEIRASIMRGDVVTIPDEEIDAQEMEAQEGRLLLARHLRRERSPKLRQRKINHVKAQGLPVACEVCSFDFGATYGARGANYIEVHHLLPLHASGETLSRLEDLALLCANCHRMIHRGSWITPDELKSVIEKSHGTQIRFAK